MTVRTRSETYSGKTREHIFDWLLNVANRSMNVNGSSTPVDFEYTVPAGYTADIERLIIFYQDTGTFDAGLFGNGLALTTGIQFEVNDSDGTQILDLVGGFPIKSNGELQALCHDWSYTDIGTGDNIATARWTLSRSGAPVFLKTGESLTVTVADDLTGLTEMYVKVQGLLTKE